MSKTPPAKSKKSGAKKGAGAARRRVAKGQEHPVKAKEKAKAEAPLSAKTEKAEKAEKKPSKKKSDARVVLVTGASGFLGRHLVERLMARGHVVRALVRHPSHRLEKAGVEVVLGDVCDAAACAQATRGVRDVIHAAGLVSRDPKDAPRMFDVHVEGTRNVLLAASAAGCQRAVVVSTSGTVAVTQNPEEVSDEGSPYRQALVGRWPYYLSKIYQEQTTFELGERLGLEVVIVGPSLLLGPGDVRGSSTGDVDNVVRGRVPIIPKGGGVAFVDARDAAEGCILALEKGRSQERYLLSGANMTLESFLGRVARLSGVPTPRAIAAPRALRFATRVAESVFRRLDATPPIDQQSLEMAEHSWYVNANKARRELGWEPREPQVTLADTVADLQRRRGIQPKAE